MDNAPQLPWWSCPEIALALISVPVAIATYLIPGTAFLQEWRTPKFFDGDYLMMCFAAIVTFCASCAAARFLAGRLSPPDPAADWRDSLNWDAVRIVFQVAAALTIVGYLAWGGAAILRGATLSLVLDILGGSKGAASRMKEVYLVTVPGVTTLTQFGIPAMVLGCIALTRFHVRQVAPQMVALFVFAFVRAILNSERLAIIELAVPGVVVAAALQSTRTVRPWWLSGRALAVAPVMGFVVVFALFGASEYFRSWINFYAGGERSFLEFVATRFTGYYATALNNGAYLCRRLLPLEYPFFSVHFLWRFPILNQIAGTMFSNPFEREDDLLDILAGGANPEFNNGGGLLLPFIDWGFPGGLLFWFAAGITAGISYTSFRRFQVAGLLTYPIFFIAIIEAPRVLYASEGRVFPAWCAVAAAVIACRKAADVSRRHRVAAPARGAA